MYRIHVAGSATRRFAAMTGRRFALRGALLGLVLQYPVAADAQSALWSACDLAARDVDKSIPACTEVIAHGPAARRAEALQNRAVAYEAKGDLDRAIADVTEAIRIDPLHAYRFEERGEIWIKKREFQRAVDDLNQAIRLDPSRAFRFHSRGLAYLGLGDTTRAIADFTEAIRLDPVKRGFRFHARADALRSAGQYDQAIHDYDEAVALDPGDGWVVLDRGRAYAAWGHLREAKQDFATAVKMSGGAGDLADTARKELSLLLVSDD